MFRAVFLVLVITFLSGCAGVMAYREMQMSNDKQKLVRMYTQCVEQNSGNVSEIKSQCEPIIAPFRTNIAVTNGI